MTALSFLFTEMCIRDSVEGGAVLCVGIAIAAQYFIAMQPVTVVVIIFMICIIALVLEIALKVL